MTAGTGTVVATKTLANSPEVIRHRYPEWNRDEADIRSSTLAFVDVLGGL